MSDRLERAGRIRSEREPQRISEGIPMCGGPRCRRYRDVDGLRWEEHQEDCLVGRGETEKDHLEIAVIGCLAVFVVVIVIALILGGR